MKNKKFTIAASTVLALGRDSIKDHTTAVVELVKNSYDADAGIVELEIDTSFAPHGLIRVADTGSGMSEKEVEHNWLHIGYSEKRVHKTTTLYNRRKTGEKGIGRLSADRLGSQLELRTKSGKASAIGLSIDWRKFESQRGDVSQVEIPVLPNGMPTLPKVGGRSRSLTGTELRITNLRQEWTNDDIDRLHMELSLLVPPYLSKTSAFQLRFKNDVSPEFNGIIRPGIAKKAPIEFEGSLTQRGELTFKMSYVDKKEGKRKTVKGTTSWDKIWPHAAKNNAKNRPLIGPVSVRLSFFPQSQEVLTALNITQAQLRQFLKRNSGIRIYRDEIRVKPYGEPGRSEGDWLSLGDRRNRDPAGAGRASFKVGPNQIVGAVFISRDANPNLVDSSSREGLVESDALRQLQALTLKCVNHIEALHHKTYLKDQEDPSSKVARAKAAVGSLRNELTSLVSELTEFQTQIGDEESAAASSMEQIAVVLDRLKAAEKEIEEIASQNTVFRGLATVGIASAVFGHETEVSTALAQGNLTLMRKKLTKPTPLVASALLDLDKAEKYVHQIASWGKFALLRVKKDKRQKRKVSITDLIEGVLNELASPLNESSIKLKETLAEVTAKTFSMDVEAVVINFVTNAYYAVKRTPANRRISVTLKKATEADRNGFEIVVSDSGPGIEKENIEIIWKPLFSTRLDGRGKAMGTGLGLTIVKSAVEELGGSVSAVCHGPLGGAEFRAWFPGD